MNETERHIASGGGICGTCARPANATAENQGYSNCCNDRIEYGDEARETVAVANCDHSTTKVESVEVCGFDRKWRTVSETVCASCGTYIDTPAA